MYLHENKCSVLYVSYCISINKCRFKAVWMCFIIPGSLFRKSIAEKEKQKIDVFSCVPNITIQFHIHCLPRLIFY